MRAVIQRVSSASVEIGETAARRIGRGVVVLVAVESGDERADIEWLAKKIVGLRLFPGPGGRMDVSVKDIGGDVLVVSQFTLLGVTRKGTRPSYHRSADPAGAAPLYERLIRAVESELGMSVATGEFGAQMMLSLTNEGPVTIILDSKRKEI